jgi:hypothetical protein
MTAGSLEQTHNWLCRRVLLRQSAERRCIRAHFLGNRPVSLVAQIHQIMSGIPAMLAASKQVPVHSATSGTKCKNKFYRYNQLPGNLGRHSADSRILLFFLSAN